MIQIKKSQISLFVIIAIIIVVLMIFLIFTNSSHNSDLLTNNQNKITTIDKSQIDIIKNNIDECLSKELKRATIVSGLKGGFIYDNGEYYFSSIIPDDTYSSKFISNMDLNWNNLQSKALVYSQSEVSPPGVSTKVHMYTHTVEEDFEKFIGVEFYKCIDLESIYERYALDYVDYLGSVKFIDFTSGKIAIENLDVDVGNSIEYIINDKVLFGEVLGQGGDNEYYASIDDIDYLKGFQLDEIESIDVLNKDNMINISVDVNIEDISVKIDYPIRISNNITQNLFQKTGVSLNVRLKALIQVAKSLLNYKYYDNKDIDYTLEANLNKALNESQYFKATNLRDMEIIKTVILDDDSYKKYLYSIIDYDSKIFGNPFVLNFAYENEAPEIQFGNIDPEFEIYDNIITLYTTKDKEHSYDLRSYTIESQFYDSFTFDFEEISYTGPDAVFSIGSEGFVYFKPLREKMYNYKISVTDKETVREYVLNFVTGFPDNANNKAAFDCLSFKNYDIENTFPISNEFKNKVFQYQGEDDFNNLFSLSLYQDNMKFKDEDAYKDKVQSSRVYLSKTCVYDESQFEATAVLTNMDTGLEISQIKFDFADDDSFSKISIPVVSYPIEVNVHISDFAGNQMISQPLNMVIYPSSCLGPNASETYSQTSCCDTKEIINGVNVKVDNDDDTILQGLTDEFVILESDKDLFDYDMYFCYDENAMSKYFEANIFNHESFDVWDNFGFDITSLFRANVVARCGGKYPNPMQNIQSISSSGASEVGKLYTVIEHTELLDEMRTIPVSLKKDHENIVKCNFCNIESPTSIKIVLNLSNEDGEYQNIVFRTGLVDENEDADIITIPEEEVDNYNFVCDYRWFGASTLTLPPEWAVFDANTFGEDGRSVIKVSKGYCSIDASCVGKSYSPTYDYKPQELGSSCIDYFFQIKEGGDFIEKIQNKKNTGWTCGDYTITTGCYSDDQECVVETKSNTCTLGVCSNIQSKNNCNEC